MKHETSREIICFKRWLTKPRKIFVKTLDFHLLVQNQSMPDFQYFGSTFQEAYETALNAAILANYSAFPVKIIPF